MKNTILIYCFIFSVVSAQENRNVFDLIIRSGAGVNKLIVNGDSKNPSIPTNSSLGLNLSTCALIQYNKFSRIQISSGFGFKLNQLHTTISNIITNETLIKGWDPVEISETYTNSYLFIPILVNYKIKDKVNVGFGISYDYLLNSKIRKSVINNTDPGFEKFSNNFYPEIYSFILYYQCALNKMLSVLPTILISPNKTTSQLLSNSTGPSISLDIQLEIKL